MNIYLEMILVLAAIAAMSFVAYSYYRKYGI